MAQKHQIVLIDDIDEGDADETVTFALDGVTYEIDLNAGHAAQLREAIGEWIVYARRTGGRKGSRLQGATRRAAAPTGELDTAEVRQWARDNGYDVSDRGRISAHIIEAFRNR